MNIVRRISLALMLALFGQASYSYYENEYDQSAEDRDFISFASQGNLAELRKLDIKTIHVAALAEALFGAVESRSAQSVEYLLSSIPIHKFLHFPLDINPLEIALDLAEGCEEIQHLLIRRLIEHHAKVEIEKRAKQQEPMWHFSSVFAGVFVGNVVCALVDSITKGSIDLDRAIFLQIAIPILLPKLAPERGAEETLWHFYGRVTAEYVGRFSVFIVTAYGYNLAIAIYRIIVAPPVVHPFAAAAA